MDLKDIVVGSKVVCVDQGTTHLVEGRAYTVKRISDPYVYFDEPAGGFFAERFEPYTEPAPMLGQAGGLKFDGGKSQWSLLLSPKGMLAGVKGVLAVLTFGAKKYAAHSWREVEDNERRYSDALVRHFVAIQEQGITAVDEESGLLHIDHLNCNGLFLAELARK